MPFDTSVFQQRMTPISGTNALMQALQLHGQQRQNALADSQIAEQQATVEERSRLRNALMGGTRPDTPEGVNALVQVAPNLAPTIGKAYADMRQANAKSSQEEATAAKTRQETQRAALTNHMQLLGAMQTPEQAVQVLNMAVSQHGLPMQMAQTYVQNLLKNPAQFAIKKAEMLAAFASQKDQLDAMTPKLQNITLGGTDQIVDMNSLTRGAAPTTLQRTVSPDTVYQGDISRANNRDTQAGENLRAGINPDGSPIDGQGLSEQAKIAAAARYRIDGTLPTNVGRGAQGPRDIRFILNEAARQSAEAGDTPESSRIAQIANKANTAALSKLQTQQTMVGAFEKNFSKNADLAEQLSSTVDRTGVPVLNKWLNAGKRSVAGDPAISAFDANLKATVNEYAKIVGGGTGSSATAQGEIAKIESLLSAAQTPQQVKAVLDVMRKETANRMAAFEDEKAALKGSMIQPRSAQPAASGAAKTVHWNDLK